jgi:hypothetical protein
MTRLPDESLRDFLDRRERELADEIATLHGQLVPKEAELAEVRRAKGALGIKLSAQATLHADATVMPAVSVTSPAVTAAPSPPLPSEAPNPASWQNNSFDVAADLHAQHVRRMSAAAVAATATMSSGTSLPLLMSAYQHLTMKELVIKALNEHFRDGATAKQLREFFRDGWGRDIPRENLSPQLSRLYHDNIIGWRQGIWFLLPASSPNEGKEPSENQSEGAPKADGGKFKRRI